MLLGAERVAVDLDGSTLLPETTLRVQPGECGALLGAVLAHADSGEIPVAVTTVGGAAAAVLGYA